MRENLARDGQQRDSSVVMTVISAAFPFVKWEYYTLSPVLWNVACSHADLQMVVSHSTPSGPAALSISAMILHMPGAFPSLSR